MTESNIRDLAKLVDEEMDGVAREQRKRLETIQSELEEVRKPPAPDIETTDLDVSDRIREHRESEERLETAVGGVGRCSRSAGWSWTT